MFRQKQMYKSHEKSKLFNDEMKPGIKRYDPSEGTSEKSNPTDFFKVFPKMSGNSFCHKEGQTADERQTRSPRFCSELRG